MFGNQLPNPTGAAELENSTSGQEQAQDPHTIVLIVVLLMVVGIYFFYLAS